MKYHPRITRLKHGSVTVPPIYIINLVRRKDRLNRLLPKLSTYLGSVYLYKAIDTALDYELDYALGLDPTSTPLDSWQRGLGGYGNKMSHLDLLSYIAIKHDSYSSVVLEDDISFSSSLFLYKWIIKAEIDICKTNSDIALLSGWHYLQPKARPRDRLSHIFPPALCSCTIGTQFNLYRNDRLSNFLSLVPNYPSIHLDEVIANLQYDELISSISYRPFPFNTPYSPSDVNYEKTEEK